MMREFVFETNGARCTVQLEPLGDGEWRIVVAGRERCFRWERRGENEYDLFVENCAERFTVAANGDELLVSKPGASYRLTRVDARSANRTASTGHTGVADPVIRAPMPGKVIKVHCKAGDSVPEQAPILVLEAMKMEFVMTAPRAGVVTELRCHAGERVDIGATLAVLKFDDVSAQE